MGRGQSFQVQQEFVESSQKQWPYQWICGTCLIHPTRIAWVGPLLLATAPVVICLHSLALLCSGSDDDSCGGGTGTGAPGDSSHGGRRHTSGAGKFSEGGGVPVFVPPLAVSAGREFDDSCLNAFLAAALLRVVRDAVPVLFLFLLL